MVVAFTTKMMLAACMLIALVAAIDEADAAAHPFASSIAAKQPQTADQSDDEKRICCDASGKPWQSPFQRTQICLGSLLPICLNCPAGSNTSTWLGKTNTSTSVTLTVEGNDFTKVTASTSYTNWKVSEDQKAVISSDKKCYGVLRSVKLNVKLIGFRGQEPVAKVSFVKAGICKRGTGDDPDQCAAAKAITLCRVHKFSGQFLHVCTTDEEGFVATAI